MEAHASVVRREDLCLAHEGGDGQTGYEQRDHPVGDKFVGAEYAEVKCVAATRKLTALDVERPVRLLAIMTFSLAEYIVEALPACASSFLLKDATLQELVQAIRVIPTGDALLTPAVTKRLLERYLRHLSPVTLAHSTRRVQFTNRGVGALRLVAPGLSNSEFAATLHVAESSVKRHVGHLLAKLGLPDRVHLVVFAY